MPYFPVSGSLNMLSSGVLKVNTANMRATAQSAPNESFGFLQTTVPLLNWRVSYIYAIAAQIKKMAIFIQSGDRPITPL